MNEIDIRHHETVIQADELSRAVYNCSMLGRKIIAFATTRIYEKTIDKTPFWSSMKFETYVPAAEFKISELIQALGQTDSGANYESIKKAVNELRHCSVEIKENDDEFRIWNWFQFIQYSKTKDRIELHFANEIGWALYGVKDNYTALNLRTIGEFKSFYAFRFYEIALSWIGMKGRNGNRKGTWFFQMSPEEIRHTFKIPDEAYKGRNDNFIKKVIDIPLKELNELNKDFKIEVSRITRGRNLVAFRFDCTETEKEAKKLVIKKSEGKAIRDEKREINNEQEKLAKLKEKHADRWQEIFEYEMQQPCLFGDESWKKLTAENKADLALLAEFDN